MHTTRNAIVALGLSLGVVGAGLVVVRPASAGKTAREAVQTGAASHGASPNAINCRKTFTSGTGAQGFSWCYSDTGNIVMLQGPGTAEHIRIGTLMEGYALCVGGSTEGFDNGNSGTGFGGPSYPNATTVVRNTPN